jgi:hypothetical protein
MKKPPQQRARHCWDVQRRIDASRKAAKTRKLMKLARQAHGSEDAPTSGGPGKRGGLSQAD